MKAQIKWTGGASFAGQSGSGHSVVMDGPPEGGGQNQGFRPMEMILIGMGACAAFDVVQILKKGRQEIADCDVELAAERAETIPKVFTRINLHFRVAGRGLEPAKVERAINLSAEKYCSATAMLGKTAEITHDYEIIESG